MTQAPPSSSDPTDNVVARLKQRTAEARRLGFKIRNEWLDGLEATWCEIGGTKTLFLDVSQSAAEQLDQVDQAISWLQQQGTQNLAVKSRQAA